jgi:hypothetical protein
LNGGRGNRTGRKFVFLLLVLMLLPIIQAAADAKAHRTLSGMIYFTNNTPRNVAQFPVELFTRDKRRLIAATRPNTESRFNLTGIKPGKYLLKFTWPNHCLLWYRVDLTKDSRTDVRIIMDVACAHFNGSIQDLPEK